MVWLLRTLGFGNTLSLINGKYKMILMYWFSQYKPVMRFNELKRCVGAISFKTLSNTLKELERGHLVIRRKYPQIPPRWNTAFRNGVAP